MTILSRYLAHAVWGGTLGALGVLVALSAFVLFVGQGDHVGTGSYTMWKALQFVAASMPQQAYELFPMAVLLGSLFALGNLAAGNELTVIRAAGVSTWALARALLLGALVLALVCLALGELLAPNAQRYAAQMKAAAINQRVTVVDRQGVWAKEGEVFINVRSIDDERRLGRVNLYEFDRDGQLVRAATASGAVHVGGGWQLQDLRETRLDAEGTVAASAPSRDWQSSIDPDLLESLTGEYDTLSALALARYSSFLRGNRLESNPVDIYLWSRVAVPLNVVLMVLLALPFAFGPLRSTGAGQRVVIGILIGIAFYAVTKTLLHSGTVFGLDPLLTNFLPTLVLASLTAAAVARLR